MLIKWNSPIVMGMHAWVRLKLRAGYVFSEDVQFGAWFYVHNRYVCRQSSGSDSHPARQSGLRDYYQDRKVGYGHASQTQ